LGEACRRCSYADWEGVDAPRDIKPYPEGLDWLPFRRDGFFGHVANKIAIIRPADPEARIEPHGIAASMTVMALHWADDWRAAEHVGAYRNTWIAVRKGNQPWRNFFAGDLIRGKA
jgi:beta-galactosidase